MAVISLMIYARINKKTKKCYLIIKIVPSMTAEEEFLMRLLAKYSECRKGIKVTSTNGEIIIEMLLNKKQEEGLIEHFKVKFHQPVTSGY